jgi:hypothetical protein
MLGSEIEWGTVGEWVSGLGALAAAIVAVVVPLHLIRHQRTERNEAEEERHSRAVSAWLDFTAGEPKAVVVNAGQDVISDWDVLVCFNAPCINHPPDEHDWVTVLGYEHHGSLAPGQRIEELLLDGTPPESPGGTIEVDWVDPLGVTWSRQNGEFQYIE